MSFVVEDQDRKMEKQLGVTAVAQSNIEGQSTVVDVAAEKSSRMHNTP